MSCNCTNPGAPWYDQPIPGTCNNDCTMYITVNDGIAYIAAAATIAIGALLYKTHKAIALILIIIGIWTIAYHLVSYFIDIGPPINILRFT